MGKTANPLPGRPETDLHSLISEPGCGLSLGALRRTIRARRRPRLRLLFESRRGRVSTTEEATSYVLAFDAYQFPVSLRIQRRDASYRSDFSTTTPPRHRRLAFDIRPSGAIPGQPSTEPWGIFPVHEPLGRSLGHRTHSLPERAALPRPWHAAHQRATYPAQSTIVTPKPRWMSCAATTPENTAFHRGRRKAGT